MTGIKYSFFLLVASIFVLQGCSSSPTPPPTTTTTVNFTQNSQYTYHRDHLDTASATTTKDQRDSSSRDNITSTVVTTSAAVGGRTSVVDLKNSHSQSGTTWTDDSYFFQESSKLYHYNFGLDLVNAAIQSNATLKSVFTNPADTTKDTINAGWVVEADLNAVAGATWNAGSSTKEVFVPIHTNVHSVDQATEQADTTITISGNPLKAKHVLHSITISADISVPATVLGTIMIDSYITLEAGNVLNIIHSTTLTAPTIFNVQMSGQYTEMTSYK
jgi:hypothetical protein